MLESLGAGAMLIVAAFLVVLAVKRRSGLTPEQQQLADQQREIRKLKRESARRKWD